MSSFASPPSYAAVDRLPQEHGLGIKGLGPTPNFSHPNRIIKTATVAGTFADASHTGMGLILHQPVSPDVVPHHPLAHSPAPPLDSSSARSILRDRLSSAGNSPRPVSQRSSNNALSPRPASIEDMTSPVSRMTDEETPEELHKALALLNLQSHRRYIEGYLVRFTEDPTPKGEQPEWWVEYYASLDGTSLLFWNADEIDKAEIDGRVVVPLSLNVSDMNIVTPPARIPNALAMITPSSHTIYLQFQNAQTLRLWSAAIRIAAFERLQLQEAYTAALIARSRAATTVRQLFSSFHGALGSSGKYSGYVRVKFPALSSWRRLWAVISDTPSSYTLSNTFNGRFWAKFSLKRQILKGEARFYESRRDPKSRPLAIITSCWSAYAVFPERRALIETSAMIRVEGTIRFFNEVQDSQNLSIKNQIQSWLLLIPDDLTNNNFQNAANRNQPPPLLSTPPPNPATPMNTSNYSFSDNSHRRTSSLFSQFSLTSGSSKKFRVSASFEAMLTWLVCFYDAFSLYGRPDRLIVDTEKKDSMIFALPGKLDEAYLDISDVATLQHVSDGKISVHDWQVLLKEATVERIRSDDRALNRNNVALDEELNPLPARNIDKIMYKATQSTPKTLFKMRSLSRLRNVFNWKDGQESPEYIEPPNFRQNQVVRRIQSDSRLGTMQRGPGKMANVKLANGY